MFQELHLSDKTLRDNFVQYWKDGDYANCITILQNAQLDDKKIIASVFNIITSYIVTLENYSDPTFKSNRIIVSENAPSGLSSGSVWFEEIS